MRLTTVLSVEPSPGGLRFRLDVPERDVAEPLQEEFRQPLDDATLRALQESADALLRAAASPAFAREAEARGAVLYRTLVPVRLRAKLRTVHGPLLLSTSLAGLPWELLHDDEQFWGLRYALGKRLVLDRPLPPVAARLPMRARPRALVIGSDPRGDLPFVRPEVDAICEALEAVADVDCVTGPLATFDAVTKYLSQGFDLVHYCGHVVAGERTGPALLLAEERPLAASTIEANVRGRPLVFLNGCASAQAGAGAPAPPWEATVSSVAHGFLFGGALGVVGTLSDVGDRHAATLAEEFYRRALEGEAVGEALRAARVRCRAHPDTTDSPTWLSFVLYGNPAQALVRERSPAAVEEPPAPVRLPAAPVPRRRGRWAVLALLAVALVAGLLQLRQPAPRAPLVVGVMEVSARSEAVPAWMRGLTRDGLNTILSKFDSIRVYSRQKIDFVRQKRGLSEIEAAETLGMSKMLSATVGVDADVVTLDLEVVDIASGLLEASARVQGPRAELMALETRFALRALHVLGVEPSGAEMQALLADRDDETLSAYRLFSETLGEPVPAAKEAVPPPAREAPGTSWLAWPARAWAQELDPEEAAIRALLARYGAALESKRVDDLAALQVELGEKQRLSLQRYFDTAAELRVRILDVDVLVEGDEAIATFTREDVFVDGGTGRRMRLEVRTSGILAKQQGAWKIVGLRDPL